MLWNNMSLVTCLVLLATAASLARPDLSTSSPFAIPSHPSPQTLSKATTLRQPDPLAFSEPSTLLLDLPSAR